MKAFLPPPYVPVVDSQTGLIDPIWYAYFRDEHVRIGGDPADKVQQALDTALSGLMAQPVTTDIRASLNEIRVLLMTQRSATAQIDALGKRIADLEVRVHGFRDQSAMVQSIGRTVDETRAYVFGVKR